jgi:glycosyltransferase involved in cell wall biosynthesis
MRILLWHVHGSWTTAFVHGEHDYLIPVTPDRGADGLGRARTWDWPASTVERTPAQLRHEDIDVVLLQRPHELDRATEWLGRRPGSDLPAVYVEHNAPEPHPALSRHPMADQDAIRLVHVTHFNSLYWDSGRALVDIVEHGIIDPGYRYTGELPRAAVAVNDPIRRGRMVGTDLLDRFAGAVPVDVFGMRVTGLPRVSTHEDVPQHQLHAQLARRRVYLHLVRWTSLGLSVLEAMFLGMPVVGVAATELGEAVPADAGVLSTDVDRLVSAAQKYAHDPDAARAAGRRARSAVLQRYGVARFLADWDRVLKEVTG